MEIEIRPRLTFVALTLIVLGLIAVHGASQYLFVYRTAEDVYGLVRMFDVNLENNIPSLYSALLLLTTGVLLLGIAIARNTMRQAYYHHWLGLAAVFFFLSVDEWAKIHERFIVPLRSILNVTGYLRSAWIIPYGIALLILVIVYLRFLMNLPVRTRLLVIFAGICYVMGAIAVEAIASNRSIVSGGDIGDIALSTLEELLEMMGLVVFIYALVSFITTEYSDFRVRITAAD